MRSDATQIVLTRLTASTPRQQRIGAVLMPTTGKLRQHDSAEPILLAEGNRPSDARIRQMESEEGLESESPRTNAPNISEGAATDATRKEEPATGLLHSKPASSRGHSSADAVEKPLSPQERRHGQVGTRQRESPAWSSDGQGAATASPTDKQAQSLAALRCSQTNSQQPPSPFTT